MNSQMQGMNPEVDRQFMAAVDWNRPDLVSAQREFKAGAASFVAYLRRRRTPATGFSQTYVTEVRGLASEADREEARRRLAAALDEPMVGRAHGNPVIRIGAENLILALDPVAAERLGRAVLASRDRWSKGSWGTTRGICDLLRVLMAVPEIPDEPLVPFFGWLIEQVPAEWTVTRQWSESMLGSSGHNWWLHALVGFWEAGLLFPEFQGFAKFAALAPDYFEHEMRLLMYPDGFTRERSGYHWGTVQHFLEALLLAEANHIRFSSTFHDHARRMGNTLWQMMAPDGDIPRFGDTGAIHEPGKGIARLRMAAALLRLPEGKAVAEALMPDLNAPLPTLKPADHGETAAWQDRVSIHGLLPAGGRNLFAEYRNLPRNLPPVDAVLPDAGYYLMRQDWSPQADYAAINAGPVGSVVSSHAHTDLLSFELYSRGRPVLVDNGSGTYGDKTARAWRRSSAGHNVLTIDQQDQLPAQGEWRWERECTPYVNDWRSEPGYAYFSGVHEAYRHLPQPVTAVRRKLFYLRGGYWILIDRVTPQTDAMHRYDLHFHVMGPARLHPDGRLETQGNGGNLLIVPVAGASGQASLEPCPFPLDGYDNPLHLVYTQTSTQSILFVTVLVPFKDRRPRVHARLAPVQADDRELSPWEATGLVIEVDGQTDHYLDLHVHWNLPWAIGPCRGSQRLFHSRIHGAEPTTKEPFP